LFLPSFLQRKRISPVFKLYSVRIASAARTPQAPFRSEVLAPTIKAATLSCKPNHSGAADGYDPLFSEGLEATLLTQI